MATIAALRRKFEALNTDVIAQQSLEETKEVLADKNAEQMHEGTNKKGEPIGEYQNDLYAQVKHRMNPLPGFGVPDLKKTGAFYKGLYTEVKGDTIEFGSIDSKGKDLEARYGKEIFGLNDQNRSEFINETLRPVFNKKIMEATGLPFKK